MDILGPNLYGLSSTITLGGILDSLLNHFNSPFSPTNAVGTYTRISADISTIDQSITSSPSISEPNPESNHLFRLGLRGHGVLVDLGKILEFALLAVLSIVSTDRIIHRTLFHSSSTRSLNLSKIRIRTNLPLGESQIHLATTLGLQTRAFLEGATNGAGRDGEVAVVANKSARSPGQWQEAEERTSDRQISRRKSW